MPNDRQRKLIDVDASKWVVRRDLYDAVLPLLGAPAWHGVNANALVESMVWGEINAVEPPYTIRVHGAAGLQAGVAEELSWVQEDVVKACDEYRRRHGHDVDVHVQVLP